MKTRTLLALGLSASLLAVGCEEKADPAKAVTGAVSGAADKVKDAGAAAKDAAAKGTEAVKDAAAKGTDAVKDAAAGAMAKMKEEGTKWLSETVEKQWPAAKTALADLTKKAADVKDAGLKTKIMDAVKGLTGEQTEVEGLVSKLKDFKDGDYGALFTSVKDKFAGFMKKLDEVKAMLPK